MITRKILAAILLVPFLFAKSVQAELLAGAAKIDITPPVGVSLDGPISKNGPVLSVHDPLHARALVISDDTETIAIVTVDQCMTTRDVFDAAKEKIQIQTKIPASNMLMAATHTHSAPRTGHIGREEIDDEYHRWLSLRISEAVVKAHTNLAPAQIGYSSFDLPELIACRRFRCEPGSVIPNPFGETGERIKSVAGSSSKIIEPAGPTDPQFSVLSVQHADGSPLCLLGNFSVHYCGGFKRGVVSADYFGHFSEAIEKTLAGSAEHPPVVGIMSNGTSGNTGAFQNIEKKKFMPFEAMAYYGRMLAEQAVGTTKSIQYQRDATIKAKTRNLKLAVRKPNAARLQWADNVLADSKTDSPKNRHRWARVYAAEAKHLAEYPDYESIVLQTLQIGEIAIAAAPCEVFAETGLAIKAASPFKHTFNMELANGYGGYLPPKEQHELGGYETWPARSSFLEIDAEFKIRSTLIELLGEAAEE